MKFFLLRFPIFRRNFYKFKFLENNKKMWSFRYKLEKSGDPGSNADICLLSDSY
ncbi:hypothetical protein LEP1GSC058_0328 [Leptospira fainei serovar Hurstbridge str. BUT 6]|uniref:Uncharacterized protein n=1 Tax=Leptospira fainei serovar Hurstbridge str. BUT 6 TaxID=1193011 RepID=S3VGU3_9LEPT|nr:hypothetical protein LEP1GSC058_0328 [Leptospira fainei serovar Hurstbridge str. BUT 6]